MSRGKYPCLLTQEQVERIHHRSMDILKRIGINVNSELAIEILADGGCQVDGQRVRGGCLTNWMLGHSNRFRAAVSERSQADYFSAFGTDDDQLYLSSDLGLPWENPQNYWRLSPIRYVKHMNTPVLFLEGAEDCRCPPSNTEQLYVSLKKRGIEAILVIYPGESHHINKPSHRVDQLHRIMDWLAHHGGIEYAKPLK